MDNTTDEMIASVDATLANWRSAFEPSSASPTKKAKGGTRTRTTRTKNTTDNDDGDGGGAATTPNTIVTDDDALAPSSSSSLPPVWKDRDAYRRRLSTFRPDTYFAKPLALSPLVCAAYGWENTSKDILKCQHPNCGATICIAFHSSLNEEAHDKLCQQYLEMLVSSHTTGCPFRSFTSRWAKVMKRRASNEANSKCHELTVQELSVIIAEEDNAEYLINKVSDGLRSSQLYVPPYFLSLSDEFLQFEDCSGDGSITRDRVKGRALQLRDKLKTRIGESSKLSDLVLPEAVTGYCQKVLPDVYVGKLLHQNDIVMKVPYFLATFGWDLGEEPVSEGAGVILKCGICQAKAWLASSSATNEETPRKKRRTNDPKDACLKLIDSHRVYCPYVSGFSYAPGQQSHLPGW
eukprot:CAMPEP_0183702762 /NCGR_PEP_ID=MMETSP0737-20130205/766_1 /TAXON_ID=385413 /ORGANISM="Thalassiosira miniscula, Strain CCMP1093" /LENGTH=405 /DNA_ID=CAMNT_0025929433 /DNA_START=1 /DNA_END=1215 /DNA_ORIENTATION=-